jgi:quercetin dioxygenase-like cupin family protein
MTTAIDRQSILFTAGHETSFPLPDNHAVTVAPLLRHEDGHRADVFFLTIPAGAAVPRESHPFSETLVPVAGALVCSVEAAEPVTVVPGQVFHIPADHVHRVENRDTQPAIAAMLIGV